MEEGKRAGFSVMLLAQTMRPGSSKSGLVRRIVWALLKCKSVPARGPGSAPAAATDAEAGLA